MKEQVGHRPSGGDPLGELQRPLKTKQGKRHDLQQMNEKLTLKPKSLNKAIQNAISKVNWGTPLH